ncbi:unnamed protein product [Leptosia nina]|uniref:Uncharacterized protein n=1 Tax=Leptosia nina TaxID=320188 RepID=A0AAV1JES2_9NEOP
MYFKIITFVVISSIFQYCEGQLVCYACSFSSVDTDRSCLTITNSTPVVNCIHKYCTIMRQEFRDPAGLIASFTRSCLSSPDFLNHEVEDPTFRTFYRACTRNRCNIGNGIQSVTGSNLSPRPENNATNLLVPGTGSSWRAKSTVSLVLFSCFGLYMILQ